MKLRKNLQNISTQEWLNAMTPNHQDFNFELWSVAVREQMISVLAHKGATIDVAAQATQEKVSHVEKRRVSSQV